MSNIMDERTVFLMQEELIDKNWELIKTHDQFDYSHLSLEDFKSLVKSGEAKMCGARIVFNLSNKEMEIPNGKFN